jgi:CheY-like chemotaxis protein
MSTVMVHPDHAVPRPEGTTVLVVEDEPYVREPISEYLRDCGFRVLEADNATQAMAMIDAVPGDAVLPVDLVFSDVRMPGEIDGFDLAAWLGAHHPELPVLLTSGYYGARNRAQPSLHGTPLIEKPYSQAQVLDRIRALLEPHG